MHALSEYDLVFEFGISVLKALNIPLGNAIAPWVQQNAVQVWTCLAICPCCDAVPDKLYPGGHCSLNVIM